MKKNNSLMNKLLRIAVVFQIALVIVFVLLIVIIGVLKNYRQSAYDDIIFAADQKAQELSDNISSTAIETAYIAEKLNREINALISKKSATSLGIERKAELIDDIFMQKSYSLLDYLKQNTNISGAFLMLSSKKISDIDISSLYIAKSNSDEYSLKIGNTAIAQELDISVDDNWSDNFKIANASDENNFKFFNTHFEQSMIGLNAKDRYYVSEPLINNNDDSSYMFVTFPLYDVQGNFYGVFGMEISMEMFSKKMEAITMPRMNGGFYIISNNQRGSFSDIYAASDEFAALFLDPKHLVKTVLSETAIADSKKTVYSLRNTSTIDLNNIKDRNTTSKHDAKPNQEMISSSSVLNFYGQSSPYKNGSYVLYAFSPKASLFNDLTLLQIMLFVFIIVVILFNIIMVIYITHYVRRPVNAMAALIRDNDSEKKLIINPYGINEIDLLSSNIEKYSSKITHSASRLSSIINLFEKSIGGFEEDLKDNRVYLTDSLMRIFGIKSIGKNVMTFEEWQALKDSFFTERISDSDDIYKCSDEPERYYQFNFRKEKHRIYGVIIDVTNDVLEKRRLEFERDFDGLTKLLNRVAFSKATHMVIKKNPGKIGAMLFMDLDNLKFINDNYGHDSGDEYIKLMATGISQFKQHKSLVSRISGDEFSLFIYGFDTEEEIRELYTDILEKNRKLRMVLPDGSYHKLQCSTGVSWYPKDSSDLGLLGKYADFAMYEVKHSIKGGVKEFDLQSYNRNSFLTTKLEVLTSFIENELIYFAFQPIVDIKTGKIFAYKAFMRSKHRDVTTAAQILELARKQNKLYEIEKLVLNNIFAFVNKNKNTFVDYPLFFNSEASIEFLEEDFEQFHKQCDDVIFSKMVAEISHVEQADSEIITRKATNFKNHGMQIAIDNFEILSDKNVNPNFVKIELDIVRDIDSDEDNYNYVKGLVATALKSNSKVIAEGVETENELRVLHELGVDYCQGYLLYRPSPYLLNDSQEVADIIEKINTSI